ncbi:hypothetical protein BX070DRAFT_231473 [Coemansia spiralis]|nr:hypothetical protein BX070DRAFT_231473 [Coemansia spiralis]
MDVDTNKAPRTDHSQLSALVSLVALPPRPLPSMLQAKFTDEDDIWLVTSGAVQARTILANKRRKAQEEYVLAQLAKAEVEPPESPLESPPATAVNGSANNGNSNALSPQTMGCIVAILKEQPEILDKLPLTSPQILRMYAANCWSVLTAIIAIVDSSDEANRIIQDSITQPMSVVQHNLLAQLFIDNISEISSDTLFRYLDAVEASCRLLQPGSAQQVHNVRLAVKVVSNALELNHSLADAMFIELSSFCLSYSWVKDAIDLYQRLMASQKQQGY